jgi:hypothetical protein
MIRDPRRAFDVLRRERLEPIGAAHDVVQQRHLCLVTGAGADEVVELGEDER